MPDFSSRTAARVSRGTPGATRGRRSLSITGPLLPAFLLLAVFFALPMIQLGRASLSSWIGLGDMEWLGLDNFKDLALDKSFWASIWRSVILGLGGATFLTAIALLLAGLVSRGIKGAAIYRVVWFLPAIAPPAAVGVFWALALSPGTGVVNVILGSLGLGDDHAWLADPSTALFAVMFVGVWAGVGFGFLVLLGAMEDVPVSIYEAGALDGAGPVRVFFSLTLPMIRPVLSMIFLLEVIWFFNAFTLVWALTTGGPGDATVILPVFVYKEAFQFANFGPGSAAALFGGLMLLAAALVAQAFSNRSRVEYS